MSPDINDRDRLQEKADAIAADLDAPIAERSEIPEETPSRLLPVEEAGREQIEERFGYDSIEWVAATTDGPRVMLDVQFANHVSDAEVDEEIYPSEDLKWYRDHVRGDGRRVRSYEYTGELA